MPPKTTSNLEHLSLDGPLSLSVAVGIALVLLVLFTWSLGREYKILGRRLTVLFWVLRAAALGVAVWMLLAPTNVMVEVSTARKSVAVLLDVSGSMQTVDPQGTADDLRWAMSQGAGAEYPATRAADGAVAAAGIAEKHLLQATEAIVQHQRESLIVEATTGAQAAIERVRENVAIVARVSSQWKKGSDPSGTRLAEDSQTPERVRPLFPPGDLAKQLTRALDGSEFVAFGELAQALAKGRTPSEKGWRESLPDLQQRLVSIRRQLSELARDVGTHETELAQGSSPQMLSSLRRSPRLTRAAGLLDSLTDSVLKTVRETADVKVSIFDQSPTALTSVASTIDAVQAFLPDPKQDSEAAREASARAGTNISAVLEQLGRDRREQTLAAAFILTDASHNKVGAANPRELAAELGGTPVYVIPIGNTQYVRDIMVQSVFCPAVAMRNDDIVIEAVIQAYDCQDETCLVQLIQDGQPIDTRTIVLDSGFATRRVRFDRKMGEVGVQRFQVAVAPIDKELTDQNNTDDFEVNVTRNEIKLLLADELPRWEYRYLAQLFRRDPKIELDEMLFHPRMIATGKRAATSTFPVTVDEWDQYDVVILGDLQPDHFPVAAQESLIEYLKDRGGSLILIAGKEAMPAAYVGQPLHTQDVIPVEKLATDAQLGSSSGYSFHVTEAGHAHNALMIGDTDETTRTAWEFINRFAPLYDVSPWRKPRPSATTLISAVPKGSLDPDSAAASSAFLCWQPIGRGRVVYMSSPDTYRLRFLRGDRLHYKFWGQMLRWALASELSSGTEVVRIRTDKSQYSTSEAIHVVVRLMDAAGKPVVGAENLRAMALKDADEHSAPLLPDDQIPGQYTGEFKSLPAGAYRIEPMGEAIQQLLSTTDQKLATASLTVKPDLPAEFLDTRSDRALAQQIADITGGQVLPPTAIAEVLRLTNLKPEVTQKMESQPLWLQWKYLWIIFGCLQSEWIVRKIKGLS